MNDEQFDSFIRKNIRGIEECPSNDFTDNVMLSCYKYETRALRIKKYSLALVPLLLIGIIVFVPGLSGILLGLLSKITLSSILKYYTLSSIIFLTGFYIFLSERIVKFIKHNFQQSADLVHQE